MVEFFDSHVHLDADAFAPDRRDVLLRARAAGVTRFLSIGAGDGFESAARASALATEEMNIWASAGIHPHDAHIPLDVKRLRILAQHPRVVAIGETGLDFHYNFSTPDDQRRWFTAQVALAVELKKPIIIHSRNAGAECLRILQDNCAHLVGGVFHCYSEDAQFAEQLRSINFMVSFPGILTFKNSESIRHAAADIPLSQILLETDAPYLAPIPHRGKRCESSFLPLTAAVLADVKRCSIDEIARVTTENTCRLFAIPYGAPS